MNNEEVRLEALKDKMTDGQRQEMAEIISNEIKRRESLKSAKGKNIRFTTNSAVKDSSMSSGMDREQIGEMYSGIKDKVKALRARKHAQRAQKIRDRVGAAAGVSARPLTSARSGKIQPLALMFAIFALGAVKVVFTSGVVDASIASGKMFDLQKPQFKKSPAKEVGLAEVLPLELQAAEVQRVSSSPIEKKLLSELDARRVELEKRSEKLDDREEKIKLKSAALAEKLASLRTLADRLSIIRKQRDHRYEARLEQLANVYGMMAPKEAAPLIARLDGSTALSLLQRMPEKRMGQILGNMEPERAIELTKLLTDKQRLS